MSEKEIEPFLEDNRQMAKDLRMVNMAIRRGWKVDDETKEILIQRMVEVAKKTTVAVATSTGIQDVESIADSNAIRAAAILLSMESQNMTRQHHAEDQGKNKTQINIDNRRVLVLPSNGRESVEINVSEND
jgi:hypothetical protein